MARRRFKNADPAKRQALLDAAAEQFARDGYEGASLNEIILAAGLSKGGFYYYFEDKADLAATVLHDRTEAFMDITGRIDAIIEADDFWQSMRDFTRRSVEQMKKAPHEADLLTNLALASTRDAHLAAHFAPHLEKYYALTRKAWARGQELGAVRSDLPADLIVALLGAVKTTVLRAMIKPGDSLSAELLDRLTAMQMDLYRRLSEPAKKEQP